MPENGINSAVGLNDTGRSGIDTLGRWTTMPGRQQQCMMHDGLRGPRNGFL
jgi:hypothetical protein